MHIDDVNEKLKFLVSLQISIYNVDEKPKTKNCTGNYNSKFKYNCCFIVYDIYDSLMVKFKDNNLICHVQKHSRSKET